MSDESAAVIRELRAAIAHLALNVVVDEREGRVPVVLVSDLVELLEEVGTQGGRP